jgi:hypothetical protein
MMVKDPIGLFQNSRFRLVFVSEKNELKGE